MKKLIAVLAIFALFAGTAFAELTVGGQLQIGATLLTGSFLSDEDEDLGSITSKQQPFAGGMRVHEGKANFVFGDSDSGGKLVITTSEWDGTLLFGRWGFVYWKPIPQLRLQMGKNADGDWGAAQITGWGFTGEAKNSVAALNDYSGNLLMSAPRVGFYPGVDYYSTNISIYPIEGLTVNLAIPFNEGASTPVWADIYGKFSLNVVYAIPDIGKIFLSYKSDLGYIPGDKDDWMGVAGRDVNTGIAYASFYLTAVDNLGVDIGVAYQLQKYVKTGSSDTIITEKNRDYPVNIGLGVSFSSESFGIKLRAGVILPDSYEVINTPVVGDVSKVVTHSDLRFGAQILPYYNFGKFTGYFFAGFAVGTPQEGSDTDPNYVKWSNRTTAEGMPAIGDSTFAWFVNPYIRIPTGNGQFWVGFQLYDDGTKGSATTRNPSTIKWAIPFGMNFYF